MTAVPSVPVPDLDLIRERVKAAVEWQRTEGSLNDVFAGSGRDDWVDFNDLAALLAALTSTQARLVAVEAERDTLREAITDPECELSDGNFYTANQLLRRALSVVPGEREQ